MCSEPGRTEKEVKENILICAMRMLECQTCGFTNMRAFNIKRHIKRCHQGLQRYDELIKLGTKE